MNVVYGINQFKNIESCSGSNTKDLCNELIVHNIPEHCIYQSDNSVEKNSPIPFENYETTGRQLSEVLVKIQAACIAYKKL